MNDRMDFLSPFCDKHRLDGRAYRDRIGRPYYGPAALRKLLAGEPPASALERDRMARALWGVVIVVVIAAIAFGALVNL